MKQTATLLAALAVAFAGAAATVRTATETFVTNKIAAAVAAIPSPDFTTNNAALVETIEAKAPALGNYATVSNRAMTAMQSHQSLQPSTNYTDAALAEFASTGAVVRAATYGTPTRWTDATGCVWEVSAAPGTGYTDWICSGVPAGYSVLGVEPSLDREGVWRLDLYDDDIHGFYTFGGPAAACLVFDVYDAMVEARPKSTVTNLVGRVALTNDIPDMSGYATAGAVAAVSSKVETLETWAIGDETSLTVREAGTTNATLEIAYTNKTLYASANEHTNTLNAAKAYTDGKAVEIAAATDAALAGKANRAWGETTSGGAPSPEDTLVIEKKKVALTGGGNFSYLESSTGGYWVMSISLGSTWTLESLADAQNPDVPATATFRDADGNAVYTVTSTGSREVYAVSGEQYINVATVDGNDVITLTYPVATFEHPTSQYIPALEMLKTGGDYAEATAANWPDYIQATAWSGQIGQWVCTITMKGQPGRGFFRAKYTKEGTVYTHFTKPLGLSSVTISNVTYTVTVETVNGKKLMVLTEN